MNGDMAMTRTLADMTPEERQNCVGMWCDTPTITAVIASIAATTKGSMVRLYRPEKALTVPFMTLDLVTPRLDLPRAWTPSGEPVPGEWENTVGHVVECADGERDCRPRYREDSRQSALASAEGLKDDGYVAMCRFITDWEEA